MEKENFDKYQVKRLSRESIEAEEIFLDSKKIKESPESEREKMEFPIKKGKIYFVYFVIAVLLLILFFKVINLQVIEGEYWRDLAEKNRIRSYPIRALRGIIYDKNGISLVSNQPQFNLMVIPSDLLKQEDKFLDILDYLAQVLETPKSEIESVLEENANFSIPITIAENISKETTLILESKFADNPAVIVERVSQRKYLDGSYFSHIIGYLGRISKPEKESRPDYLVDDYIGKSGLEVYYEEILRGSYGKKLVEIDSRGEIKHIFAHKEPESGKDITLSIDAELQKKLNLTIEQALWGLRTDRAVGIILDVNTGKILALTSFPNFDSNKFIQGLSQKEFEKIDQNPSKPLFNRAIAGTYPPGSTIKPLIGIAAIAEEIISPNQAINCTGSITIRNKYYPNIFSTYHDWKIHGYTNLTKAIAESCNVYFYTIGGGYENIEGLGIEKINNYLKSFGLGSALGIDLPGETKGFVPNESWKLNTKDEKWYIGDTYNVSIGQGDLAATPLQIALATSVIANNGTLFNPQVVQKIGDEAILPRIIRENIVDNEIANMVKQGMREAAIYGSARSLYNLPVKVAGKTGTAQAPGNATPHSWFTGFAPYENPEIVITILVENGGEGSAVAVPIAKEILEWYYGYYSKREKNSK